MKFNITFKKGLQDMARLPGLVNFDKRLLTVADMEKVLELEKDLERFTGYRVHIETEGQ
jgi:hypothetical protein